MSEAWPRSRILRLQADLYSLMTDQDDYVIVSLGTRGPNIDMADGNAVATVCMGKDEATCEAKYLDDAINLARARIMRERKAREEERKKK